MKKIDNFKAVKLNPNNLYNIKGGDGNTNYHTSTGDRGTDTYSDDDNSGNLSCNDTITFDNGTSACMACN